jgi:hypothetical protein
MERRPRKISNFLLYYEGNIHSYKPVKGEYAETRTKIFDVTKLKKIHRTEIPDFLYADDDFVVPPEDTDGRGIVGVKAGKLYFEFDPAGKNGFTLKLYLIDRSRRKLYSFVDLSSGIARYPEILFEHLLPVSLGAYYSSRTLTSTFSTSLSKEETELRISRIAFVYRLKSIFTQLMLGKNITEADVDSLKKRVSFPSFLEKLMQGQSIDKQETEEIENHACNLNNLLLNPNPVSATGNSIRSNSVEEIYITLT